MIVPMTSDFDWARFREAFGDDPGVLPDGEVLGSTEHEWDAVFTMLHRSGWKLTTSDGHSPLPPNRHGLAELESFAVWPVNGIRINFFPGPHAVIFDLDLRELVNQATVDGLAHLMRKLGTTLRRDVVIREEGSSGAPVLRYTTATDQFSLS
ncbi:hypothetical protein [Arthrobacter bambusae]|uniref:hypothetical protein n=1 Tax=Arthrobacter bambusae TaxID=1338426 RepID=UPI0027873733|nr:hypothetical protein [Arthrobacter bambusae]MDQ0028777.1 hypothetical protein [Arthrobacter bambusae]MDQ0096429.1 hypothetical protein [Arthrobacter bambusae]